MNIRALVGLGFLWHRADRSIVSEESTRGKNPHVRNLLECLLGKVFDQRSAQRFPIVLPEVNDMVSSGGLGHIERGLTAILSVPEATEKRKPTLSSGNRKELKYQNTNSSKISRLFKESVAFVRSLGLSLVYGGPSHLHFEILIPCRT